MLNVPSIIHHSILDPRPPQPAGAIYLATRRHRRPYEPALFANNIMYYIKQIVALCLLLHAELRDQKAVDLLNKIQSMLFALESDQLAMTARNTDLTAENVLLKSRIVTLEAAR